MITLSTKLNITNVISNYNKLAAQYPVATVSAINKTATQAMNYSQAEIKLLYTIKPSVLNKKNIMRVKKAYTAEFTGHGNYEAILIAEGKGIPLIHFKISKAGLVGVSARVLSSGMGGAIKRAFIAKMKSGHKGVFQRAKQSTIGGMYMPESKGKWGVGQKKWIRSKEDTFLGGNKLVSRLPIEEKYGPGAAVMFRNPKVQAKVKFYVVDNFARIFKHEIEWRLSKK